jgi:hypothetical protein
MKKFTLFLISIFAIGSLMAQQATGPSVSYGNMGSSAMVIYSQMTPYGGVVASQKFTDLGNKTAQVADDFTIDISKVWQISSINILGNYFNGSGTADAFTVQIFADSNGVPASTPLYEQTGLSYSETSGNYSISLSSDIVLHGGHYWLSVFAEMDYAGKGQWGWAWEGLPQDGNVMSNRDPDQVLGGSWPTTWEPGTNTWPNAAVLDLCFQLNGSEIAAAVPVSNWAIIFGVLLIGIFMTVRYRRSLA